MIQPPCKVFDIFFVNTVLFSIDPVAYWGNTISHYNNLPSLNSFHVAYTNIFITKTVYHLLLSISKIGHKKNITKYTILKILHAED